MSFHFVGFSFCFVSFRNVCLSISFLFANYSFPFFHVLFLSFCDFFLFALFRFLFFLQFTSTPIYMYAHTRMIDIFSTLSLRRKKQQTNKRNVYLRHKFSLKNVMKYIVISLLFQISYRFSKNVSMDRRIFARISHNTVKVLVTWRRSFGLVTRIYCAQYVLEFNTWDYMTGLVQTSSEAILIFVPSDC